MMQMLQTGAGGLPVIAQGIQPLAMGMGPTLVRLGGAGRPAITLVPATPAADRPDQVPPDRRRPSALQDICCVCIACVWTTVLQLDNSRRSCQESVTQETFMVSFFSHLCGLSNSALMSRWLWHDCLKEGSRIAHSLPFCRSCFRMTAELSEPCCLQDPGLGSVNIGGAGGLTLRPDGPHRMRAEVAGHQLTVQLDMQPLISALNGAFNQIYTSSTVAGKHHSCVRARWSVDPPLQITLHMLQLRSCRRSVRFGKSRLKAPCAFCKLLQAEANANSNAIPVPDRLLDLASKDRVHGHVLLAGDGTKTQKPLGLCLL